MGKVLDELYLNSRREWMERYGDIIHSARHWQLVAFLSMGVALVAVGGLIWLGSQSGLVPYVVAVDQFGEAMAVSRADKMKVYDQRIIKSQLARWIRNVRMVSLDAQAQHLLIKEVYAMLHQQAPAYQTLTRYYAQKDPFKRAQRETVSIQVKSVLPHSEKSWQIDWLEKVYDRRGTLIENTAYQGLVTLSFTPVQDEASLLVNPLGIYVESFHWSSHLEQE